MNFITSPTCSTSQEQVCFESLVMYSPAQLHFNFKPFSTLSRCSKSQSSCLESLVDPSWLFPSKCSDSQDKVCFESLTNGGSLSSISSSECSDSHKDCFKSLVESSKPAILERIAMVEKVKRSKFLIKIGKGVMNFFVKVSTGLFTATYTVLNSVLPSRETLRDFVLPPRSVFALLPVGVRDTPRRRVFTTVTAGAVLLLSEVFIDF